MGSRPAYQMLCFLAMVLASGGAVAWADAGVENGVTVDAQSTQAGRAVTGRWSLTPLVGEAGDLQTQIGVEAGAGLPEGSRSARARPEDGTWRDLKVTAQASWKTERTQVSVGAVEAIKLTGIGGLSEDRAASIALDAHPASPIAIHLSGEFADNYASRSPSGGLSGAAVSLTRETAAVVAGLTWTVSPQMTLKGQQRVESASLTWRGAGLFQGDGAVTRPLVEGVLRLGSGSEINLTAEQFASPFDLDRFAALAQAMLRMEPSRGARAFLPDREWRLAASAAQSIGPARVTMSVVDASLQSSTELALNVQGQNAPVAVLGGRRTNVSFGLEAPFSFAGAPGLVMRSAWTQRLSELRDPVTGLTRSISGEAPWDAQISFVYTPFANGVSFGVDSQLIGPRTYYEPTRLREMAGYGQVGSFIEFTSAGVALRLQVENLLDGAARGTETQYRRDRSSGQILQVDHRLEGASTFSLTLKHKV